MELIRSCVLVLSVTSQKTALTMVNTVRRASNLTDIKNVRVEALGAVVMNSSIFWVSQPTFPKKIWPPSSGSSNKPSKKP
jgi:hypothetical protein